MKLSTLKAKNRILATFPIDYVKNDGRTVVDLNANKIFDIDPSTDTYSEPMLDVRLSQLKDFAKQNDIEGLLTKDCLGEINTLAARRGDNGGLVGDIADTLSEVAQTLNPFPNSVETGGTQWAIDAKPDQDAGGTLYLFAPKNGNCH